MIFAAGLGTRLKPITDTKPKALVEVDGQPLIWHVMMALKKAGFGRIVVNVHHFAEQIIGYLEANQGFGLDVRISDERGKLLETGGGIRHARPLFSTDAPILIHNVDILSNARLAEFYDEADGCDAALLVSRRQTRRYLLFDESMKLRGWRNIETGELRGPVAEEPATAEQFKPLAFSGIHAFSPRLFENMETWPERFPIIDFYLDVCKTRNVRGVEADGLQLLDVGKPETLARAASFLKNNT